MKEKSEIRILVIVYIMFICVYSLYGGIKILDNIEKERSKKLECIRVLANDDEILSGCDKYFMTEEWYNNFMDQMYDRYDEIKLGVR